MFPTPTVQDSENDGGPSQYKRNTVPLNAIVKMLPTPSTMDHIERKRMRGDFGISYDADALKLIDDLGAIILAITNITAVPNPMVLFN